MSRIAFILFIVTSVLVALVSFRFLALGLENAFPDMIDHVLNQQMAFLAHVIAAPVALALGVLQFVSRLRTNYPTIHRWVGRVYVIAVLVGGASGLTIAPNAVGGPIAGAGFGLLAVIWIAATLQAIRLAMAGRVAEHRRWMMRSFALTFAAVTLRLQLPFLIGGAGMSYAEASLIVAWSCWVPNLLFVEWLIARKPAPAIAKVNG